MQCDDDDDDEDSGWTCSLAEVCYMWTGEAWQGLKWWIGDEKTAGYKGCSSEAEGREAEEDGAAVAMTEQMKLK